MPDSWSTKKYKFPNNLHIGEEPSGASEFVGDRGSLTTIVSSTAENRWWEGSTKAKREEALGPLPLERHASGWRRQVAYGTVMVVPSPVATMENVPALLDV